MVCQSLVPHPGERELVCPDPGSGLPVRLSPAANAAGLKHSENIKATLSSGLMGLIPISVLPSSAAGNPNREGEAPAEPDFSKISRLSKSFAPLL